MKRFETKEFTSAGEVRDFLNKHLGYRMESIVYTQGGKVAKSHPWTLFYSAEDSDQKGLDKWLQSGGVNIS